jgi:hypothetical protein
MLPRVAEMDDLQRSGEELMGQVADQEGAVADDDLLLRPAPAAPPSFAIEPQAKRLGSFDGLGATGRILVARRPEMAVIEPLRKSPK